MNNKLCGLFLLSFGLLFTILFALSSDVNAQSSYDSWYKTTDQLILQDDSWMSTEEYDITNSLGSIINGIVPDNIPAAGIRYMYQNDSSPGEQWIQNLKDDWNTNKTSWAITQVPGSIAVCGGLSNKAVLISYTTDINGGKIVWDSNAEKIYLLTSEDREVKNIVICLARQHYWPNSANQILVRQFYSSYSNSTIGQKNTDVYLNFLAYAQSIEYPDNYAGEPIRDSFEFPEPIFLKPDYDLKWSESGLLNVKYLQKSLPHFLTGISYVVVEKMNEDWNGIDENLTSYTQNPAGWLDWDYQLPGAGYYMVRLDHNQQIDSPPWEEGDYEVNQWYVQFYYDGKTAGFVSTVGKPPGMIVNDIKNPDSLYNTVEEREPGILDGNGLLAFIMAPIEFIKILPQKAANCEPITFPLFGSDEQLPCVSPMLKSSMPVVVALIQTSMWAFVIYGIAFNLFRLTRDVSNPQKDGIEVTKL